MNRVSKEKTGLFLIIFVTLVFFVFSNLNFLSDEIIVRNSEPSIWQAALGFIVIYIIKGIAMVVPSSALYIAAGVVFPSYIGILITYVGLAVSQSIGYAMGKKLGEEKVNTMLFKHKKVSNFLNKNKEHLFSLCFMSRMLHLPFGLVSLFFGALNVNFVKYSYMSLLGVTPLMIPTVLAGSAITNPLSAEFLVPFGFSSIITLAIFIAYKKKTKKNAPIILD
ncbi:MAG: VTT domain-containing protein [Defluviitaleaceae bacterium]|nr:VTT domain-containing protein [Defluviitaleaceae bacterium]